MSSKIRISLSIVFTIALLLSWSATFVQQAPSAQSSAAHVGPIALSPPKVGAVSVVVAPSNPHRAGLYVSNPNAVVTLWVSPTGKPAAVNGAGSTVIEPLQGKMFGPPDMPNVSASVAVKYVQQGVSP